ncbi:hypothetical protein SK128_027022, partial [Halocaridina rubra]
VPILFHRGSLVLHTPLSIYQSPTTANPFSRFFPPFLSRDNKEGGCGVISQNLPIRCEGLIWYKEE